MMSLKLVVGFVVITLGLMLGMTLLLSLGNRPGKVTASSPKAAVSETTQDLGTMKVSEEKQVDFTLRNEGQEPLKLTGMNSSCNCTFGQLIYQGKISQEYGMHAPSGFLGEIKPGEEGVIRVIYRPKIMPVYGVVERQVFVETNDPRNPKLTFNVKVRVE